MTSFLQLPSSNYISLNRRLPLSMLAGTEMAPARRCKGMGHDAELWSRLSHFAL